MLHSEIPVSLAFPVRRHHCLCMAKVKTCLAIDPGVTGAAALVSLSSGNSHCAVVAVYDLPVITEHTSAGKVRRSIDPVGLSKLVASVEFDILAVERLTAPPGIHSITAYSLGKTAGTIGTVAALAERPVKLVSPSVWKRSLAVPPDKNGARRFATDYFGTDKHWPRAMDHNRAEAALIGVWALIAG